MRNDKATADAAYELRSRRVDRSGQEPDIDKDRVETSEQAGNTLVEEKRNVMAHAQKADLVFQRNERVHLYGWGCQFS